MVANQNIRPCWILIKTYKYASKSALIKEMKMLCPRWFMRLYVGNGSFSKWIQSSNGDTLNGEHFFSGQERQERAAENYKAEVFQPQKTAAFVFMWGKPIPCVFLTPFQGDSAAGATCEAARRSEETRVGGSGREERRGQERDAGAGKEETKWEGAGGEEQQHVVGVVQHEVARKSSWHRRESGRSCKESGEAGIEAVEPVDVFSRTE